MRAAALPLTAALAAVAVAPAQAQVASAGSELAFGRFAPGTGGSVTIRNNGARSAAGAVVLLPSIATAASFTVEGSGNRQVLVTLPPDGSVTMTSGANSMAVHSFTSSRPNGVLNPGKQPLTIGATLQVAPNQRGGAYAGVFHITLEYQ